MLNYLTYNGTKSTDLGVYVTGSGSFDAAEMDADKYEIAGRNGDLIIPKNRYKNIQVSYPAFIPKSFMNGVQSVRNWMRSSKAYARLEDTYDVNHFRLGLANGVQSFEPVNRNDASNFQLNFDCRPERFLKTGETPLTIEPEAHSYSGEIVSFETVAVDDMTKAEVSLSPIQSGSGDPSPTNVRPITGHTQATLNRTGKNLLDTATTTSGNITFTQDADGYVTASPHNSDPRGINYSSAQYKRFLAQGSYVLSVEVAEASTSGSRTLQVITEDGRTIASRSGTGLDTDFELSFTLDSGTNIGILCKVYNAKYRFTLVKSGDPTAYTPYTGASFTLSLGQTVYGGTFDWVSGKLVVDMAIVDLGTLSWIYDSGNTCFYAAVDGMKVYAYSASATPVYLSSQYKSIAPTYSGGDGQNGTIWARVGTNNIRVRDTTYTDAAVFKTAMSGVQLVYELATPIEIDLTPTQVQTLLGLNNVWSDGSVEIEYADPFNVDNPTYFEARPLFEITNPAQNDVLNVNGKTITFLSSYTGTVTIDCETMNCYSGYANMNYLISATDFPVLNEGLNIVTWSGSGTCTMTPRWWEL